MRANKIISLILTLLMLFLMLTPSISAAENLTANDAESLTAVGDVIDTACLQAAIDRGDSLTQNGNFTEESYENYRTAYAYAMLVLHYGQSRAEIDEAKTGLENAIDGLVPVTTSANENNCISGDADLDEKVTVKDATVIQKHIANIVKVSEEYFYAMDVNLDSRVNIKDATEIQKYVAGLPAAENIGKAVEPEVDLQPSTALTEPAETRTETSGEDSDTNLETLPTLVTDPTEETESAEVTEPETTPSTDPTEVTLPDFTEKEIPFKVVDGGRVEGYGNGSGETELYLVNSVQSAKAVLSGIERPFGGSGLYIDPALNAEYNDEYFEENALIISLNCVGGSGCTQTIDSIAVKGNVLTVYRTITRPFIYPADMNYQYVLMEVSKKDTKNITLLENVNSYNYLSDDPTKTTDAPVPNDTITIYYTNSQFWSDVNIHFWGGTYSTSWPGEKMEFAEHNIYGQDVYKFSIPADTAGVVFNAGVNMAQTVDVLTDIKDGCGFYATDLADGKWQVKSYVYSVPDGDGTAATAEATTAGGDIVEASNKLSELIHIAEHYYLVDGNNYIYETALRLSQEIEKAKEVFQDDNATYEEIIAQTKALQEAMDGLEVPDIDTDELWAVIERSIAIADNCEFTAESYKAYSEAYGRAYGAGLYGQDQQEVEKAKADLEAAVKGLVPLEQSGGRAIDFTIAEEGRIQSYGNGSGETELHLVNSVQSAEAVLSGIETDPFGNGVYLNPTLSAKYDDEYFEDNALVILLSCVGGSCCKQDVYSLVAEGNRLFVNRMLTKPALQLCDMNYQYVLMEVSKSGTAAVTELVTRDIFNCEGES